MVLGDLKKRVEKLEYHSFNRRFYGVEQAAAYLVGTELPGDYLEFGVYRGNTFLHAYKYLANLFPKMKFWAFDSFEGLPAPKGLDKKDGFTSNYHAGEFACSKEEFTKILKAAKCDPAKIELVKGWYDKTLTAERAKNYKIKKAAFIWIDCDLYESTVPILKFITPYLQKGTVIVFDDYHAFRNLPDFGEQKAIRQWLKANPKLKITELFSYGYGGVAFTVLKTPNSVRESKK